MPKAMTTSEANARFSRRAKPVALLEGEGRKEPAQQGLAALAGLFPDGEDLAFELEQTVRNRRAPRTTKTVTGRGSK